MSKNVSHSGSSRILFVSGIDTGIGKTVATGLLSRFLRSRGIDHCTVKMVQTGCDGFSEDLEEHRAIAAMPRLAVDVEGYTAPQIFRFPASPALAARLEGRTVDLKAIDNAIGECLRRHRFVVVEGAGGLLVPLTDGELAADFAAKRGWPLLLVASGRLGAINHILLSLEAAATHGLAVAGVVMNASAGTDQRIVDDAEDWTLRALHRAGAPNALVRIPAVDPGTEWPIVDFSPVLPPCWLP